MRNILIDFRLSLSIILFLLPIIVSGQTTMINPYSRDITSLNGKWNVIIDPTGIGEWRQVWQEKKPEKKTDFFEYSFEGGPTLNVPGDFNSQLCELTFYEGTVWYKKQFDYSPVTGRRLFLHFGAVNYTADVFLNGNKIGSHEGGFTPFQFEITGKVSQGKNTIIVKVDNKRLENGLPGIGYDWLNFGGITRDVSLINTSNTFISDYNIQLEKGSLETIKGFVKLDGSKLLQKVKIKIPEAEILYETQTNEKGRAEVLFSNKFELWSPRNPKLYNVIIESETDTIQDQIGFRCIEMKNNQIWFNKTPVFLKSVNIHEENPYTASRAFSIEDARILLSAAKELGCNMVRLAHYPHSENMIREAERMGLMVWDELPIYQHIKFSDNDVPGKIETMLNEMVCRDKNRCSVIIWSLSNETYYFTPGRNEELIKLTAKCRAMDSTRLITHVVNTQGYQNNTFDVWDTLYKYSDIISLNEYIGWYVPWQGKPVETKWKLKYKDKPVFISEFGGEALCGNNQGPSDEANNWNEGYQANIYKNQIEMFSTIPNLCGVCPWLLFDYRSPGRMHPVYQNGYNRKGLLSEKGQKKKAWFIMSEYYKKTKF